MYSVGDKILYGASGVMSISDIREECIGDTARRYYVLSSATASSASQTFVPVDNADLVALMRPLLTRDEASSVLSAVSTAPDCAWHADNRKRAEIFKKILESGDRVAILAMIRTVNKAGKLREAEGKKNFLSDDTVAKRAEKLVASELSIVLGISEDAAMELVKKSTEI